MIKGKVYLLADHNGNVWKTAYSMKVAMEFIDSMKKLHPELRMTINEVEKTKVVR